MQKIKQCLKWLFSSKKPDPELVAEVDAMFQDAIELIKSEGEKVMKAKYKA